MQIDEQSSSTGKTEPKPKTCPVNEARCIASNIAKLPDLLGKG